ncbi:MAG: hypothetical protein GC149_14405 [Gammaproteobacteria bacterium]|nr:hypothetical protein [Gammaproteobacteria bacterium]
MSKKIISIALVLVVAVAGAVFVYNSDAMKQSRLVKSWVARNIEARGGAAAWQKVDSLKLTGLMDLGQGLSVPYVLEQKRPGKMCFGFVFNDQTALQCADGKHGWKIAPFRGRSTPEAMTEGELREIADSSDPYGLLYNYAKRDIDIELLGHVKVGERDAIKLKLTMDKGAVRWIYLDAETALELKLEAMRTIAGRQHRVETVYSDWKQTDGLLIAHRQETTTEGDPAAHFLTVETVSVNPYIADARFEMPAGANIRPVAIRKTPYEHE